MNADQAKFLAEHYARVIESEIPTTKKVLAAVAGGNGDYKPDPKSRSAIQLARHIATADAWFVQSVLDGSFVFDQTAADRAEAQLTTANDAASFYEKTMREKVSQLRATPADKLAKEVDFFGFMKAPAVTFLAMAQNHSVHHRGQLAAYLRAMGSAVPSIYGGSADEPFQAAASA
jgi:uncharacterized damage-inducible protein DinB